MTGPSKNCDYSQTRLPLARAYFLRVMKRTVGHGLGDHRPERGLHLDRGLLYKVHGLQQLHQLLVQNDGRYRDVPYMYRMMGVTVVFLRVQNDGGYHGVSYVSGMMGVIVVTTARLYRWKLIVHETPHDVPHG